MIVFLSMLIAGEVEEDSDLHHFINGQEGLLNKIDKWGENGPRV